MVDLETYGISNNAVIRQIAAVPFFIKGYKTERVCDYLNIYVDTISQKVDGRTDDVATLAFWNCKENKAVDRFLLEKMADVGKTPATAAKMTCDYLKRLKKKYSVVIIGRGATTFDFPILKNFCEQYGQTLSHQFYNIVDMRSFCKIMEEVTGSKPQKSDVMHKALTDCFEQIKQIQFYLDIINPSTR